MYVRLQTLLSASHSTDNKVTRVKAHSVRTIRLMLMQQPHSVKGRRDVDFDESGSSDDFDDRAQGAVGHGH